MPRPSLLAIVVIVAGCLGTLSACTAVSADANAEPETPAASQPGIGSGTADVTWTRLVAEFPFELAPGYSWPTAAPKAYFVAGGRVEDGVLDFDVAQYWLCGWETTAVTAHDATSVDAALDEIAKFKSIPAVDRWYIDEDVWEATVVHPAPAATSP
ncbi:hypothetical protein QT381_05360 [Galbitalea sp. SE-J8]|uniref:hypothetical protein n=1 Tax=Galbitalea sp. SE-J8 TaxID=3054952 RepID=UPI00259D2B24|nr:hypothetical protein [Galbitalea sp. SE-J8]MDM4762432.1 hypothetical protein [Galbitalea sp. SE-J8]